MIKDQKLDYSVLGNLNCAQVCLVFIHGWGGNKESFKRVAKSFNIRFCLHVIELRRVCSDTKAMSQNCHGTEGARDFFAFVSTSPMRLRI